MPSPLRLLLGTLATLALVLLPACGDTEGSGTEGESPSTSAVEDGRSGSDEDESPDVYNDNEEDGEQPDEQGTDAGSN